MRDLLRGILRSHPELLNKFEAFNKIQYPDWDEHVALSPEEATEWKLELEELLSLNAQTSSFPYDVYRNWYVYWGDFFKDPWRQTDAVSVEEIIKNGLKLCDASLTTGNQIDFYW